MNCRLAGTASALILSMFATACGGGGDGGGGEGAVSGDSLPTMASSTVTSQNAPSMAGQSYATVNTLSDQNALGNQLLLGVSVSQSQVDPLDAPLALLYKRASLPNLVVGATVNCTNGGTATYNESGSTVSVSASNCLEGSLLINGTVSITLDNMVGDPEVDSSWSADMAINAQNLTATQGGIGTRITGDMNVSYSQASSQVVNASASGQSLHVRYLENGSVVLNTLLKPYNFTLSQNANTYTSAANFTYASTGSAIGDVSYSVVTNSPFQSTGTAYPHSGSFTLTATKGKLILTALDSTNVRLELDTDGNGSIDDTINTTWTALTSAV